MTFNVGMGLLLVAAWLLSFISHHLAGAQTPLQVTLFTSRVVWNDAYMYCKQTNMDLAVLDQAAYVITREHIVISQMLLTEDFWTGVFDWKMDDLSQDIAGYAWAATCSTLDTMGLSLWHNGEPRNTRDSFCVAMVRNTSSWKIELCNTRHGFLCQRPIDECRYVYTNISKCEYETNSSNDLLLNASSRSQCTGYCDDRASLGYQCWGVSFVLWERKCQLHRYSAQFPTCSSDSQLLFSHFLRRVCYLFSVNSTSLTSSNRNTKPNVTCPSLEASTSSAVGIYSEEGPTRFEMTTSPENTAVSENTTAVLVATDNSSLAESEQTTSSNKQTMRRYTTASTTRTTEPAVLTSGNRLSSLTADTTEIVTGYKYSHISADIAKLTTDHKHVPATVMAESTSEGSRQPRSTIVPADSTLADIGQQWNTVVTANRSTTDSDESAHTTRVEGISTVSSEKSTTAVSITDNVTADNVMTANSSGRLRSTTENGTTESDVMTDSTTDYGVMTDSTTEYGVMTDSTTESDVMTDSTTDYGVMTDSTTENDVMTDSTTKYDVMTDSTTDGDVMTYSTTKYDVMTDSTTDVDVMADSTTEYGAMTDSTTESDVMTDSTTEDGVMTDGTTEDGGMTDNTTKGDVMTDNTIEGSVMTDSTTESDVMTDSTIEDGVMTDSTTVYDVMTDSPKVYGVMTDSTKEDGVMIDSTTKGVVMTENTTEGSVMTDSTSEDDVINDSTRESGVTAKSTREGSKNSARITSTTMDKQQSTNLVATAVSIPEVSMLSKQSTPNETHFLTTFVSATAIQQSLKATNTFGNSMAGIDQSTNVTDILGNSLAGIDQSTHATDTSENRKADSDQSTLTAWARELKTASYTISPTTDFTSRPETGSTNPNETLRNATNTVTQSSTLSSDRKTVVSTGNENEAKPDASTISSSKRPFICPPDFNACVCRKNTRPDVDTAINVTLVSETIRKSLSVDVKALSLRRRRKECAKDDRQSAAIIAAVSMIVLIAAFGAIVFNDFFLIRNHIRYGLRRYAAKKRADEISPGI